MQCFRPSFDQVWMRSKIAHNPQNIYMRAYLSNGYLNPLSNFNFKKVNKSADFQPWTRAKITSNLMKIGVHAYLSNGYIDTFKIEFWESRQKCIIATLDWPTLNKGQNSSKSHKNRCPFLSLKWVPKSTLEFQFQENQQKCIFLTLVWPTLNEGQNRSKSHKKRCSCLSFKWVPKSTFKTQFREIQ